MWVKLILPVKVYRLNGRRSGQKNDTRKWLGKAIVWHKKGLYGTKKASMAQFDTLPVLPSVLSGCHQGNDLASGHH